MSLSSKQPGVVPGWFCNGKKGTTRIKRSAKKFARRLKRRKLKRAVT